MSIFSYEQLHSVLNHRKTKALFYETCKPDDEPLMTLGRRPRGDLLVLRDLFIELVSQDPTEYEFADHVFGDFAFWKNITEASWMQPHLEEWRMVADVKRKSFAFGTIVEDAQSPSRTATTSAKFLIEEKWRDKRNPKTKAAAKASTEAAAQGYSEDVARLKDYM